MESHAVFRMTILNNLVSAKQKSEKQFAVLIDPDKVDLLQINELVERCSEAMVDYFFIGGSLLLLDQLDECLHAIKSRTQIPLVLFPGDQYQISNSADAILFLSLISGRNPEFLIGKQVLAAPHVRSSNLEVLPTGYILVDGGRSTSVSYMSNTTPIPHDKTNIAVCTAMAGEMLGLKLIYMDAGSGARTPVSNGMIGAVKESIDLPIIIGGGIQTPEQAMEKAIAGADMIVVGNAIEKDKSLIIEMSDAIHSIPVLG